MRFVALALALTLVGACATAGAPKAAAPLDRASEELDILEAVFRYQFAYHFSIRSADHYDCIFLSLPGKQDPPAAFLSRFAGQSPLVEPASSAAPEPWDGIRDRVTGGRGVLFHVNRLRWIDDKAVEVDGGHYECSLGASDALYQVERRSGAWVVVSRRTYGSA